MQLNYSADVFKIVQNFIQKTNRRTDIKILTTAINMVKQGSGVNHLPNC